METTPNKGEQSALSPSTLTEDQISSATKADKIMGLGPKQPTQTFGQKLVRVNFNPSNDDAVYKTKMKFADLIDECHKTREESIDHEVARNMSLAITNLELASMWAVKGITYGK